MWSGAGEWRVSLIHMSTVLSHPPQVVMDMLEKLDCARKVLAGGLCAMW